MAATANSDLRARVDAFVVDLTAAIRQSALEAVRSALDLNGASPAPRGRPAKAGKRTTRKARPSKKGGRIRRTTEDLDAMGAAITDHVQVNPGARLEQISSAIGEPSKDLKRPIQILLAAGRLRTEGKKRGTMYFASSGRATKKKRTARKQANRRKAGKKRAKRTAKRATRKTKTKKAA